LLFLFLKLFPIVHNQILLYDQYGEKNKQNEEKFVPGENKFKMNKNIILFIPPLSISYPMS